MEKQPDEIYCPQCGKPIKKEAAICPNCGVQVKELKVVATPPPANPIQNIQTVIHKRPLSIVSIVLLGVAFLLALLILGAFHLALLAVIIYFPTFIIITFSLIFVNLRKNKNRTLSFLISTCVMVAILIVSSVTFSNMQSKKIVAAQSNSANKPPATITSSNITTTEAETTAKVEYPDLGQAIEYDGIRVNVTDCMFTDSYKNNISGIRKAPEGAKYFWLYVKAENISKDKLLDLPFNTDFAVLYNGTEILTTLGFGEEIANKPTYNFKSVYPGYGSEGWIIYEIYKDAQPSDIKIRLSPLEISPKVEFYWKIPEKIQDVQEAKITTEDTKASVNQNSSGGTIIPTELEAREKIEEGAFKVANLGSDRQSLRNVVNWLPTDWQDGMMVVRDDNPTRWGKDSQMYYYLEVKSQGGVLYVTWGAQNFYYYKSWTEIKESIIKNYPAGTTDFADGSFIAGTVWSNDPLWQKEELWKDDTYWKGEFWDYINNLKNS